MYFGFNYLQILRLIIIFEGDNRKTRIFGRDKGSDILLESPRDSTEAIFRRSVPTLCNSGIIFHLEIYTEIIVS